MMTGINIETISPRVPGEPMVDSEILEEFDSLTASKYKSLAEVFQTGKILLIVNDLKRATPTAKIIGHIDEYLKGKGQDLELKPVDVIVATGSHKPPSEDDLKKILGDYYKLYKPKLVIHKGKECEFELVGTSDMGTPIKVDKLILGYDRIVAINSVEPHYFAGYTGGRKSFLPGVSHYDTIEANHRFAMDEGSKSLALEGNPVHEDMKDVAGRILEYLSSRNCDVVALNCVMSNDEIYGISAGDVFKSWERLIPRANELFTVGIKYRYDIVIAETAYPQNRTLYHALMGFENGKLALRDGGILILEARCNEGIGLENFYNVMTSAPTASEIIESVKEHYTLGAHKTTNLLAFMEKNRMYVVSELPDDVVTNCHCTPFSSVSEALYTAIKELGTEKPRILKIEEANNVVPLVS